MENNRTIIAIVLIVLLWSGYSLFFAPQRPAPQTLITETSAKIGTIPAESATVTKSKETHDIPMPVKGDRVAPASERIITVSSDLYDIQLSTTGATVHSISLKKYRETNKANANPYELLNIESGNVGSFQTTGHNGFTFPPDQPYLALDHPGQTLLVEGTEKAIRFSAVLPTGLTLVKTYTFYPNSYQVGINFQVINTGAEKVTGNFDLSLVTPWDETKKEDSYTFLGSLTFDGEKLHEDKANDLGKNPKVYGNTVSWSGYTDKYFVMILSPESSSFKQIHIEQENGFIFNQFSSPVVSLENGGKSSYDYTAFLGPKEYDLLQVVGHQFERAIDYGFFRILAHPLMIVLKFFYRFVGNYGAAIILLTVCIKLIFWPLTQKSYSSMKGMQKLQPEMQKLREKFANDKQRLNQEMMAFYKEKRVNPLGGCLPMLIQIPVFFALYKVLLGSIELRHAPFMFWITDLSAADTLFTTLFGLPFTLGPLPLIMGFTMYLQQKMTPTNMDPTQAKIMNMMPVIFTFLFLSFPSGLVIYWLVNNLLTILQQYLIRRQPT